MQVVTLPIRLIANARAGCIFHKMDPRGFPTTLPEFQRVFPDDGACARYLEHLRWPTRVGAHLRDSLPW
jgi:hypothetical protein